MTEKTSQELVNEIYSTLDKIEENSKITFCPILKQECLKEGCAWWMEELKIGSMGNPTMDSLLKKAMESVGFIDGKIPAMCSIKYRSMK